MWCSNSKTSDCPLPNSPLRPLFFLETRYGHFLHPTFRPRSPRRVRRALPSWTRHVSSAWRRTLLSCSKSVLPPLVAHHLKLQKVNSQMIPKGLLTKSNKLQVQGAKGSPSGSCWHTMLIFSKTVQHYPRNCPATSYVAKTMSAFASFLKDKMNQTLPHIFSGTL